MSPLSSGDAKIAVAPDGEVRRPLTVSGCSGVGESSFVGGGDGNVAATEYDAVLGGASNQVCDVVAAIGDGYMNIIGSGDNRDSWIGGGYENTISGTSGGSVISGGEFNSVTYYFSSLGGGYSNTASGEYSTIAGGNTNAVSGQYGTVAGGNTNTASGIAANVAGGANNVASGGHATVLGGSHNTASGSFSLAAGLHSNATMPGSFVWTDESDTTNGLTTTVANQFLARAAGGFTLWTNAAATVGATLAPGSGAWASTSDRNMKTNVVALDDAEVLDRVDRLPISSWSYVTERGVRHVGPMAQDFYAAFGVGADDRHITSIDEDGVALAAIKALSDQNRLLREQTRSVRADEAMMKREIARLDAVVEKLAR